jgi:hypothetical protein
LAEFLYPYQYDAVSRMANGCILNGGVGSGKSRTGLFYYYELNGGKANGTHLNKMKNPMDLYIITTAMKRDKKEWDLELAPFSLSSEEDLNAYSNKVVVDSWNNIKKYTDVKNSFFIFDEQRVVGYGTWTKSFLKISKKNEWIMLSATPGDTWMDYIPVFIANGFYKNKSEFVQQHVVYSRWSKFPKVDRYVNTRKLERLRKHILVDMDYSKRTKPHHEYIACLYDRKTYHEIGKTRWDIYDEKPIENASELCYIWRKLTNSDKTRGESVLELCKLHPKVIIFYNFDYEREILLKLDYADGTHISEWSGHAHEPIPSSKKWVYLVQYTAGCEGWNSIQTDTIIFYSQNYSYKVMAQACGRIDRLNTPFTDLWYYHLISSAPIDLAIRQALKRKKKFNEGKFVYGK